MQSILIADDSDSIHEMLDAIVQPLGYQTVSAKNGEEALQRYTETRPEMALVDIKMSPVSGLELLQKLKEIDPSAIVIMMSGHADVENALVSLKGGAFDFLTKPFKVDVLIAAVNRAAAKRRADEESSCEATATALLGDSEAMKSLNQSISRVAHSTSPVLVQGEGGTQKGLIAATIHKQREGEEEESSAPFVRVDCKEQDENDIRTELLGNDNQGGALLEQAEGGTLFIANIDALSIETQIDIGNLMRDIKEQVRFIASTSENLEALVEAGSFDESLFYRLSSLTVSVPSLSERPEDIPMVAKRILKRLDGDSLNISAQARSLLQSYSWPGNIKELKCVIETAASQCKEGEIQPEDLPEKIQDLKTLSSLTDYLEKATLEYKQRVLRACKGDPEKAASILGCEAAQLGLD